MKCKVKILIMLCLAAVFTVMMATPAFAITKADNAGKSKDASEVVFGDPLMGERLPFGEPWIDEDIRLEGGVSGPSEPDDLNCPGEDDDWDGPSKIVPPEDENNNPNGGITPGGSEGRTPPTVVPPSTTTTTPTPPPSTNTSSGKLPNTGTQLVLAAGVGLLIMLVAYGARRAAGRRVR